MANVKVTGEYYRVAKNADQPVETGERYDDIPPAVEAALRYALEHKTGCYVERVTTHEASKELEGTMWEGIWQPLTETVTGREYIPGPDSFRHSASLSRNHAVNGWVVPETIEVSDLIKA